MPLFIYRAVDGDGNPVDGTMEGPFAHQVVVALQQQGLAVNAVRPARKEKPPVSSKRLSCSDLDHLNTHLLMATKSALPLAPAIAAMIGELDNRRIKHVLGDVKSQLEAGHSLEYAVNRQPNAFSPVYRAMVAAGEASGNLPGVFRALTDYSKTMVDFRSTLRLAMMYPVMVVFFAAVIIWGLLIKVVPVFAEIFNEFGKGLPAPTRSLVNLSDFVQHRSPYIAFVFVLVAATFVLVHVHNRRTERRYWVDWVQMHTPILSRVLLLESLMRFSRALALLLDARVPLLESLELAGAAAGNAVLHRRVRVAARDLNAGSTLGQALQKSRIYDSGSTWLISNAEKNGNLEETLEAIADEQSRSLRYLYRSIMTLIGPVIVMCVGLIIGYIVLSLYLPIFSLGDAISGS